MRSLACTALLLVCVSCMSASPPAEAPPPEPHPEIKVHLEGSPVQRGGEFTAVVHITNHGQAPHRLNFATGCQLSWIITTGNGVNFTTRCLVCTQAPTFIILADEFYETTISVPTRRLCEVPWPFSDDSMPAGNYTITVQAIGYEDQFDSPPVPFEVVD